MDVVIIVCQFRYSSMISWAEEQSPVWLNLGDDTLSLLALLYRGWTEEPFSSVDFTIGAYLGQSWAPAVGGSLCIFI